MVFYTTHPLLQVKTEDLEAVSDGGLSEDLEDVSEDEEFRVFQVSFPYLVQGLDCTQKIMLHCQRHNDPSS